MSVVASLGLDGRELDYLGPLLSFIDNELAEVGGREGILSATFVGRPRHYFEIGESSLDFSIQPIHEFGGRILGRAYAEPGTCLVAHHEIAHGRDVRQRLRASGGGYSQRTELAGLDMLNSCNRYDEHDLHLPGDKI